MPAAVELRPSDKPLETVLESVPLGMARFPGLPLTTEGLGMIVAYPCSVSTASEVAAGPSYCSWSAAGVVVAAAAAAHLAAVVVVLAAEQAVDDSP